MDFEEMKKKMVIEVLNIRTQNYDKNTGRYECAADFSAEYQGEKSTYPITYASELLEGQDDFYVTVQGLSEL